MRIPPPAMEAIAILTVLSGPLAAQAMRIQAQSSLRLIQVTWVITILYILNTNQTGAILFRQCRL